MKQQINLSDNPNPPFDFKDIPQDFIIRPLKKTKLIDSYNGLDDECEFEKNMFNFGEFDDLPPSDRYFDNRCKPE